ncbi:AAA family ATPase [Nocardia lasii]|uniref:AAA family ATPase n=1 Tax=Nocardia lasii TaxID=1616107 RepID=A0ABW1JJV8_9NOCA
MSRNNDSLPMLPPWLSESDVTQVGYEAPVENLPQDDEIDEAPKRRRFLSRGDDSPRKEKGRRRRKSDDEPTEAPQSGWSTPPTNAPIPGPTHQQPEQTHPDPTYPQSGRDYAPQHPTSPEQGAAQPYAQPAAQPSPERSGPQSFAQPTAEQGGFQPFAQPTAEQGGFQPFAQPSPERGGPPPYAQPSPTQGIDRPNGSYGPATGDHGIQPTHDPRQPSAADQPSTGWQAAPNPLTPPIGESRPPTDQSRPPSPDSPPWHASPSATSGPATADSPWTTGQPPASPGPWPTGQSTPLNGGSPQTPHTGTPTQAPDGGVASRATASPASPSVPSQSGPGHRADSSGPATTRADNARSVDANASGAHTSSPAQSGTADPNASTQHPGLPANATTTGTLPTRTPAPPSNGFTPLGPTHQRPDLPPPPPLPSPPAHAEAAPVQPTEAEAAPARLAQPEVTTTPPTQADVAPARLSQPEAAPARLTQPEAAPVRPTQAEAVPARLTQPEAAPVRPTPAEAVPAQPTQGEAAEVRPSQAAAAPAQPTHGEAVPSRPTQAPPRLTDPTRPGPATGPSRAPEQSSESRRGAEQLPTEAQAAPSGAGTSHAAAAQSPAQVADDTAATGTRPSTGGWTIPDEGSAANTAAQAASSSTTARVAPNVDRSTGRIPHTASDSATGSPYSSEESADRRQSTEGESRSPYASGDNAQPVHPAAQYNPVPGDPASPTHAPDGRAEVSRADDPRLVGDPNQASAGANTAAPHGSQTGYRSGEFVQAAEAVSPYPRPDGTPAQHQQPDGLPTYGPDGIARRPDTSPQQYSVPAPTSQPDSAFRPDGSQYGPDAQQSNPEYQHPNPNGLQQFPANGAPQQYPHNGTAPQDFQHNGTAPQQFPPNGVTPQQFLPNGTTPGIPDGNPAQPINPAQQYQQAPGQYLPDGTHAPQFHPDGTPVQQNRPHRYLPDPAPTNGPAQYGAPQQYQQPPNHQQGQPQQYGQPSQPGWGAQPQGYQPSLDDVPVKRAKKAPGSGWRKAVHHVSGGAINPGMSAEELRLQELVARIRQPVRGDYRIAVLSLKGGVGKTTTTTGLGSIFASIRGDRVIAVDANPDFGTLSQRVAIQTRSTVRDLLLDPSIERYSDVRRHTSQGSSRLEVLASERDPAASEAFNDEEYRAVARILQRFYNIILTDCGTGLMHSAMSGVLDLAHSLVLISSAAIDGARSAAATLDWLSLHGHDHLVRNAVVVINLPREGSPNVGVQQLREYFLSRCRAVHIIPFDEHLSEGAEIDLHRLHKTTKRAYVELAATVADEFGADHRRFG